MITMTCLIGVAVTPLRSLPEFHRPPKAGAGADAEVAARTGPTDNCRTASEVAAMRNPCRVCDTNPLTFMQPPLMCRTNAQRAHITLVRLYFSQLIVI